MRIAILWTRLSGYLNACLRALASRPDVELYVCNQSPANNAHFPEADFSWLNNRYEWILRPDVSVLSDQLLKFRPHVILGANWSIREYRKINRQFRGRDVRVVCIDNQWHATLRQVMGRCVARVYLHHLYDAIYVTGERQADWARCMGFKQSQIWYGCYSCDTHQFGIIAEQRQSLPVIPEQFLYVGRLEKEKAISELFRAYQQYRQQVDRPWPMMVVGEGSWRPSGLSQ